MNNYLTQLLLITIIITAGGPAALPPPPTATVTQTVTPSETPSPTQTAIPTATPYPPLQTEGPYLLFQRDEQTLVMMDADGMGRKYIEIPQNAYISVFIRKGLNNRVVYRYESKTGLLSTNDRATAETAL